MLPRPPHMLGLVLPRCSMVPSQWYALLAVDLMSAPFANITLLVGMLSLVLHVLTCNRSRCPVVRVVAKDRVRETSLHAGSDQN